MKTVDEKMDDITNGKNTRAGRQRQEIIDQRRKLKEAEKEEHSLAHDVMHILDRFNKRLIVVIIVLLALWFATIGGFVYYLSLYDYSGTSTETTTTIDAMQDGNGVNIVGGGDVSNGADSKNNENITDANTDANKNK